MELGSVAAGSLWSSQQASGTSALTSNQSGSTGSISGGPSKSGGHHSHGAAMMSDVLQALNSIGVTAASGASASATSAAAPNTTGQGAALSQFMQDLYSTIQSTSAAQAGVASAPSTSGYGSVETSLQTLITQLGNGPSHGSSGALGKLQSDFRSLVASSGGIANAAGSPAGAASTPNLQAFLSSMLQNMQAGTATGGASAFGLNAHA